MSVPPNAVYAPDQNSADKKNRSFANPKLMVLKPVAFNPPIPPADTLIFVHLPKTAGTNLCYFVEALGKVRKEGFKSYRSRVPRIQGQSPIKMTSGWQGGFLSAENDLISNPTFFKEINFISGHFPFGLHEHLNKPAQYIVLVRDPIERELSSVNFDYQRGFVDIAQAEKYLIEDYIDNPQTRLLAGPKAMSGVCDENTLKKAKENIEKNFLLAGIQEDTETFIQILASIQGWGAVALSQAQVTGDKVFHTATEDLKQKLKVKHAFDIALYEWVKKRWLLWKKEHTHNAIAQSIPNKILSIKANFATDRTPQFLSLAEIEHYNQTLKEDLIEITQNFVPPKNISKILKAYQFDLESQQINIIQLMQLAGCFEKNNLVFDLAETHHTENEISEILKAIEAAQQDPKLILNQWPSSISIEKTHHWLIKATQKGFLIPRLNHERWQAQCNMWIIQNQAAVAEIVNQLKLNDERAPVSEAYDALIVLGSTQSDMEQRLTYAKTLIEERGVQVKHLYLLCGERIADASVDGGADYLAAVATRYGVEPNAVTEKQIMLQIFEKIKGHGKFSKTPYQCVEASKGNKLRANTQDSAYTLCAHLDLQFRHLLFISSAPHIQAQEYTLQNAFSETKQAVALEVAGPKNPDANELNYTLDALGGTLFGGYVNVAKALGSVKPKEALKEILKTIASSTSLKRESTMLVSFQNSSLSSANFNDASNSSDPAERHSPR